jgi:hypothetical protein
VVVDEHPQLVFVRERPLRRLARLRHQEVGRALPQFRRWLGCIVNSKGLLKLKAKAPTGFIKSQTKFPYLGQQRGVRAVRDGLLLGPLERVLRTPPPKRKLNQRLTL